MRMVTPGRFELPTCGLGNRCSIHLSYGATTYILAQRFQETVGPFSTALLAEAT
jgi:hypothetical protein